LNIRAALAGLARTSSYGRHLHEYWPTRARLFDERSYSVPRCAARTVRNWRSNPEQVHEGETILQAYNGGDFVDIGAFQGVYELVLAAKANNGARFLACEPDRRAFPILLNNLGAAARIYPQINFFPLPIAAGSGQPIMISYPAGEAGHPQFGSGTDGMDSPRSITVDTLVDSFGLNPSLVKIDVEGAELSVLRGLTRTIDRFRPMIMLEIHKQMLPPGVSEQEVKDFLLERSYAARPINFSHALWVAQS
jgi:FkbM family methyltransferase